MPVPGVPMASRALESRFERMSVNDENDPGDGSKYLKSKVLFQSNMVLELPLTTSR